MLTSAFLGIILGLLAGVSQQCSNGGSVIGTDCSCQSFFSGPDCTTYECINGGYLNPDNTSCICPPGYRGLHCETVKASLAPSGSFSSSSNSLNVINFNLHTFYWGARTYSNIKRAFKDFANSTIFDSINLIETTGSPYLTVLNEPDFSNVKYNFMKNISSSDFKLANHVDAGLYWSYPVDVYTKIIEFIKCASLSNSAITIVTQHLPSDTDQDLAQQMILSFGIRINVFWISDKTFNNCTDAQISNFKAFSESTGGFFAQLQAEENDPVTYTLVQTLLRTHSNPQYLQMQEIGTCKTAVAINFNNDANNDQPVYVVLRGTNVKTDAASLRACGTAYATSFDAQLAVFTLYNPQCSTFNIIAGGACSAVVFTNYHKTDKLSVQTYLSFVEDKTLDASRYAIIENVPFYAGVHVESLAGYDTQINAINFAQSTDILPLNVENKRISAFEWVSSDAVQCKSGYSQFLQLNITVSGTEPINRYVRINCLAKPVATTTPPVLTTVTIPPTTSKASTAAFTTTVSTTVQYTSTVPVLTTVTIPPTTSKASTAAFTTTVSTTVQYTSTVPVTTTTATCSPSTRTSTSLFFAYSTELTSVVYDVSRNYVLSSVPLTTMSTGQTLSSARLESIDEEVRSENNKTAYSVDLSNFRANSTLKTEGPDASNAIQMVRKYLGSEPIENAVIILLLTRLPSTSDAFTATEYGTIVNKNIKIFTILSVTDLIAQGQLERSGSELNKIAALTNGHYVIADGSSSIEFNDYSTIVNQFMKFGYSQDLLYTRNIAHGSSSSTLGSITVPSSTTLTVTLSFPVPDNQLTTNPSLLRVGFRDIDGKVVSVDLASTQNYTNSNFYTATLAVSAGVQEVVLLTNAPYDTLLRVWIDKSYDQYAYYVDLNGGNTTSEVPNNRDGAALRLGVGILDNCKGAASITINDCVGSIGTKFDASQITTKTDPSTGLYSFVPYFCDLPSSQCITGAENKFDIQIVTNGFSITRSFLCASSSVSIDSNCQGKDAYGNYQCSGVSPFKRGPTGKITDCSRHGTLFYNSSVIGDYSSRYQCQCESDSGFTGESCESASCKSPNTDGLSIDNLYRTYTIVIGTDGFKSFFKITTRNAKTWFGLETSVETIWKYQVFAQCRDGQLQNLYSGGRFDLFNSVLTSPQLSIKCDYTTTNTVDLSTVYSNIVTGIGKNVRGAIVYYTEIPESFNVSLSNFLSMAQIYQQQLFVVTIDEMPTITQLDSSISQAAMSTGGFLIQSYIDNDGVITLNKQFITDIVSNPTSIAYVAQNSSSSSSFDVTLDTANSVAYIITWKRGGGVKQNNNELASSQCVQFDDTMILCNITGAGKNTITFTDQSTQYSAIAYVTNDVSPKIQVVSTTSQDIADALSTETSSTTILSVYVPDGYNVVANDNAGGSARIAQRSECTFGYTSYSVFADSKYSQGSNFAQITLQKTGGSSLPRYFPIITTSDIVCQNGGTPNSVLGSCSCASGFKGPDCSLVDCSSSLFVAKPNSWSNVCVCDSLYDDTCAKQF